MKNNKGQALVEFIIILPLAILLLIAIIDFGNIFTKKYSLQNDLDLVVELYKDKKYEKIESYVSSKSATLKYSTKDELLTISLYKKVNIMSPILNVALGKEYEISVEKTIYESLNK